MRAIGERLRARARSAAIATTAAAPLLTPGALPAVTLPSFLKAGLRPASTAAVVSSRIASSRSRTCQYVCIDTITVPGPPWPRATAPLAEPVFGSALMSLRLYLLTHSPAPFRRRNIFIDASVGSRV